MTTVSRLDKAAATRRAQRVRDGVSAISEVVDTLVEIQERQDWLALGYKTWSEYCEGEFGPARLKLSPEQRGQVVAVLVASGMPKRRVAAALGVSDGTVRNDVKRSKGAQNYALPGAAPLVEGASDERTAAAVASRPADGGANDTTSTPPADGPGTQTQEGEADQLGPSVTPKTTGEPPQAPGDEDDTGSAAGTSDAQPPATGLVPDVSDETGAGQASEPVDGEGQQEHAGVSGPAVPSPEQPKELIEWFAGLWDQVDADVSGPLLTSADLAAIYEALDKIAFTVGLLDKWQQRAQP